MLLKPWSLCPSSEAPAVGQNLSRPLKLIMHVASTQRPGTHLTANSDPGTHLTAQFAGTQGLGPWEQHGEGVREAPAGQHVRS